jgi:type II restriction enzyme
VDLCLDSSLVGRYTNRSQVARVVTEAWASANLYCPACPSDSIEPSPPGTEVVDFLCPDCEEPFQLKSQSRPIRRRVNDSAYDPMIQSVRTAKAPSFFFLHYDRARWSVADLFLVPRHFLSPSMIEERPPLGPTAERAGWIGCNILLSALPPDARIDVVTDGITTPREDVRESWRAFSFLRNATSESRGWIADVLACVREIRKPEFTLADVYGFEARLRDMHKDNQHVRPKIRQQLQVLRDRGVLEFLGHGKYRVRLVPQTRYS